jgi:hypothetical protein
MWKEFQGATICNVKMGWMYHHISVKIYRHSHPCQVDIYLYSFFNLGPRGSEWSKSRPRSWPHSYQNTQHHIPEGSYLHFQTQLVWMIQNNNWNFSFLIFSTKYHQNTILKCATEEQFPTGLYMKKQILKTASSLQNSLHNFQFI